MLLFMLFPGNKAQEAIANKLSTPVKLKFFRYHPKQSSGTVNNFF